jgi:hypothetical protein
MFNYHREKTCIHPAANPVAQLAFFGSEKLVQLVKVSCLKLFHVST